MKPTHEEAERLAREALEGLIDFEDARLLAAIEAFPDVGEQLRAMHRLVAVVRSAGDDAQEVQAAANRQITAADRRFVGAVLRREQGRSIRPRRQTLLWAAVAAMLAIAVYLFGSRQPAPERTGMLGALPVSVERTAGEVLVRFGQAPSPDSEYRLQLVLVGATAPLPERCNARSWPFPSAWMQVLPSAKSAELLVQLYAGTELQAETRIPVPGR